MTDYKEEFIYPALKLVQEDMDSPEDLVFAPETCLFGSHSALTSLDMVNLLINIETLLEEKLGMSVTIASDKAMSRKNSPFKTVESLCEYLSELVEEAKK